MQPSLLLVEDDLIEARRLESILTRLGYACTLAGDGDAALELLLRRPFDVVLLDLVLPELDGMGVLAALRAQGVGVPVVAAVTAANVDAASSAIRAGAVDFVVKPAGALRLEVSLANAVARGRSEARPLPAAMAHNVIRLAPRPAPARAARPARPDAGWMDEAGHVRRLDEIEADMIRFACDHYGGRMSEVARRLGIGRSSLYRKLAALGGMQVGENQPAIKPEPFPQHIVAAE